MAATSQMFGTWIVVLAVTLNTLGWFWTHHRLDLLATRLGASESTAASMRQLVNFPATSRAPEAPVDVNQGSGMPRASQFDLPGIVSPTLHRADDVKLSDDEKVIGVQVRGEARAYVVKAFEANNITSKEDLRVHIVSDMLGDEPICITYCDRTHSTRVLTNKLGARETSEPMDVRLGGWAQGLILLVNGNRYDHHSSDLPLEDLEYTKTTWGKWRAEHTNSSVYLGPDR